VFNTVNLSLSVTMDRYTRYYVNQSGDGEIGFCVEGKFQPTEWKWCRILLQRTLRFCLTSVVFGAKAVGKEALKTVSNILTEILNKQPEQSVSDIVKTCFGEAEGKVEEKITKMTGSGLRLKRKRKPKKILSLKVNVKK